MLNPWKVLTDDLYAKLADPSTGFNPNYALALTAYGLPTATINFASGSKQYFEGYLDPDAVRASQVLQYPGLLLYTTSAEDQGVEKFRTFSGEIKAHLDFYFKRRKGAEVDDIEKYFNSIKAAALNVVSAQTVYWASGIVYNHGFRCDPSPVDLFGDGFIGRVPIQLTFGVNL